VIVDYPSDEEEFVIVQRVTGPRLDLVPIATTEQLRALQQSCREVYVDPALIQYAVKLVSATRDPSRVGLAELGKFITYGSSPRGSINLTEAARALALMRGRRYVLANDMMDLVHDVLRHRLVLSYEALSEGISADDILDLIKAKVAAPAKPLQSRDDELKAA